MSAPAVLLLWVPRKVPRLARAGAGEGGGVGRGLGGRAALPSRTLADHGRFSRCLWLRVFSPSSSLSPPLPCLLDASGAWAAHTFNTCVRHAGRSSSLVHVYILSLLCAAVCPYAPGKRVRSQQACERERVTLFCVPYRHSDVRGKSVCAYVVMSEKVFAVVPLGSLMC